MDWGVGVVDIERVDLRGVFRFILGVCNSRNVEVFWIFNFDLKNVRGKFKVNIEYYNKYFKII